MQIIRIWKLQLWKGGKSTKIAIFCAKALLAVRTANLCELYTVLSLFYVSMFPWLIAKRVRLNLSGSINRGTCPSTEEDLFQDLHITGKNYKAEINTSPIITHCRLGFIPRFPWLFVLIKCLHGTQGRKVISSCQSKAGVCVGRSRKGREVTFILSSPLYIGCKSHSEQVVKKGQVLLHPPMERKRGNCLGNQRFNNIAAYVNHFLLLSLMPGCLLSAGIMEDLCKEKHRQYRDTGERKQNKTVWLQVVIWSSNDAFKLRELKGRLGLAGEHRDLRPSLPAANAIKQSKRKRKKKKEGGGGYTNDPKQDFPSSYQTQ